MNFIHHKSLIFSDMYFNKARNVIRIKKETETLLPS